ARLQNRPSPPASRSALADCPGSVPAPPPEPSSPRQAPPEIRAPPSPGSPSPYHAPETTTRGLPRPLFVSPMPKRPAPPPERRCPARFAALYDPPDPIVAVPRTPAQSRRTALRPISAGAYLNCRAVP